MSPLFHIKTRITILPSLPAEVSHDDAKFLSFLPRRERPLLAGKILPSLPVELVKRRQFTSLLIILD